MNWLWEALAGEWSVIIIIIFTFVIILITRRTLWQRKKEMYHYSESLVSKTVNWPGTNILVSPTYAVLLQSSEGSKYPKRMANFREQERTLLG